MDKFGIFNLLNSFLGFANEKRAREAEQSAAETQKSGRAAEDDFIGYKNENRARNNASDTAENAASSHASDHASNPVFNLVSSSAANAENAEKKNAFSQPSPLVAGMLSAMRSHDEFVKRVRENNAKNDAEKKN